MKVIFSERAYAAILAETTEKIKTETGGLFLGKYVDENWYVIEAIDPGPKSVFQVAYFEYDQQYTQHLINKVANLYNTPLSLIGLWHRHPGSYDQFSSTDDETNAKYASMRAEGAISGLVNIDPSFRLTMYHVSYPSIYSKIEYDVGDYLIPKELLQYKSVDRFLRMMDNILGTRKTAEELIASRNELTLKSLLMKINSNFVEVSLNDQEAITESNEALDKVLDVVMGDISYIIDHFGLRLKVTAQDQSVIVQDNSSDPETLSFQYIESIEEVVFQYKGKMYKYYPEMLKGLLVKQETIDTQMQVFQSNRQQLLTIVDTVKQLLKKTINGEE